LGYFWPPCGVLLERLQQHVNLKGGQHVNLKGGLIDGEVGVSRSSKDHSSLRFV